MCALQVAPKVAPSEFVRFLSAGLPPASPLVNLVCKRDCGGAAAGAEVLPHPPAKQRQPPKRIQPLFFFDAKGFFNKRIGSKRMQ